MKKRMTRFFQISAWITTGILTVFISSFSCKSPFSPRTPEPPKNQERTNWIQPTNARDVLINLRNAIQDQNLTNYMNCFTNTPINSRHFGYKPDYSAQIRYPGIWNQWTLVQEENYIKNVFAAIPQDSLSTLIYFDEGIENPFPDSTIIIRDYELIIGHNRNPEQFPRKAKGRAEFYLSLKSDGFWAIYFWIDDSFEGLPSWSDLKATFVL